MITCCAAAAMLELSVTARQALAVDMEQLHDLTGGAVPVVTLEGHDTFSNEYVYSVKVINRTGDPIVADTLVVVLSSLQDPSGKAVLESIEVVNPAGTIHGRPYFMVTAGGMAGLPSYRQSLPVNVRLRSPNYVSFFPPSFRVHGLRHTASEELMDLIEELRRKGVLSEAEAYAAFQRLLRQ